MDTARLALVSFAVAGLPACTHVSVGPLYGARVAGASGGSGWGARVLGGPGIDRELMYDAGGPVPIAGMEMVAYEWGSRVAGTFGVELPYRFAGWSFLFARPSLAIVSGAADEGITPALMVGVGLQVDGGVYVRLHGDDYQAAGVYLGLGAGCSADVTTVDAGDGAQCTATLSLAILQ